MSHLQDALRLWAAKTLEQTRPRGGAPGVPIALEDPSIMDVLDAAPPELRLLLVAELARGPGVSGVTLELEGGKELEALRDDADGSAGTPLQSKAMGAALRRVKAGPATNYGEAQEYLLQLARELRTAIAHEAHVRIPTTVATTFLEARSGQLIKAPEWNRTVALPAGKLQEWTFHPESGSQLSMPFDEPMQGGGPDARHYLGGNALRAYMASWALEQMYEDPDGIFLWNIRWFTLDLCKRKPAYTTIKGKRYERVHSTDERALNEGLHKLLDTRITGITSEGGQVCIRTPEPLIQEVTSPGRSGAGYYHSPLVRSSAKRNFMQVPHAVCALHADRLPMGIGLARWWRARFDIDITRGAGVSRTTLRELLETIGERPAERARRDGRSYWTKAALQVVEVMRDGDLGEATVTGEGPDAVVTLVPSSSLATAYNRRPTLALTGPSPEDARRALEATRRSPGRPRKPRLKSG